MAQNLEIQLLNEGTDYEKLQFKGKWTTWSVDSIDRDGDVEIQCESSYANTTSTECLFLSQEELKQLISFLQKQVKP